MSYSTPHQRDEEDAFLSAIAAPSADTVDRLAFADWRQENVGDDDPVATVARSVSTNRLFLRLWAEVPAAYQAQIAAQQRYRASAAEIFPDVPNPPSLAAVWRSFSPEQWRAAESLREPTLVLIPPLDFAHCVTLLNEHPRTSNQYQTYVDPHYDTYPHPAPTQWQAFLVEGEQNMPKPDQAILRQSLRQSLDAEEEARPPHVQGIDRYLYAWLLLADLERSHDPRAHIDSETHSLLNADAACAACLVPDARFVPEQRRVIFLWYRAIEDVPVARLRRAVGGDVA